MGTKMAPKGGMGGALGTRDSPKVGQRDRGQHGDKGQPHNGDGHSHPPPPK